MPLIGSAPTAVLIRYPEPHPHSSVPFSSPPIPRSASLSSPQPGSSHSAFSAHHASQPTPRSKTPLRFSLTAPVLLHSSPLLRPLIGSHLTSPCASPRSSRLHSSSRWASRSCSSASNLGLASLGSSRSSCQGSPLSPTRSAHHSSSRSSSSHALAAPSRIRSGVRSSRSSSLPYSPRLRTSRTRSPIASRHSAPAHIALPSPAHPLLSSPPPPQSSIASGSSSAHHSHPISAL
ncbi:E1A-binding protein p400-like [Penaeus chinensis]|uniref:E1A-binding protein p400-like n=1 Tax=Penaeus chinensis TaxID=139456 RepID=UPI001FB5B324|nr:E1A-binding protein p400-like [Penaeus chinensis]